MISTRRTYLLARGSIGLLRERGIRALGREVHLRLRNRLLHGSPLTEPPELRAINAGYERWREHHAPSEAALRAMRSRSEEFGYKPVISVIVPVFEVDEVWLRAAIDSVLRQAYPYWELRLADDGSARPHIAKVLADYVKNDARISCVFLEQNSGISTASNRALKASAGEYVALLDHDDELAPDALYEVAALLNADPRIDVIYTDEDRLDAVTGALTNPYFKPGWSPDLLLAMNYLTHLVVCRRTLLDQVGGFRPGIEPGQDYDLMLRVTESTAKVAHLPKVLYHWRSIPGSTASSGYAKPQAQGAAKRCLEDALVRRGVEARVEAQGAGRFRIRYPVPPNPPVAMIRLGPRPAPQIELGSIEIVPAGTGGAWGSLANAAVQDSGSEFLLFLGEDVVSAEPGWVQALLEQCCRSEVGITGARLVGSDGKIFAAGIVLTTEQEAMFAFRGLHPASRGYFGHGGSCRNCSGVCGCFMVRRSVFEELKGFHPDLPSPLAELDLCLRAHDAGYRVICTPHATVHLAHSSRELPSISPEAAEAFDRRWKSRLDAGDPFLNPNLRTVYGGLELNFECAPTTVPEEPEAADTSGSLLLNDSVACSPHPNCDLCGTEGQTLLDGVADQSGNAPGRWQLLSCPRCGLIWLNPRPERNEIGKLYPESYFTHQDPRQIPFLLRAFRQAKQPVIRALFTTLAYEEAVRSKSLRQLGSVLASVPGLRERAAFKVKWATGPAGRMIDVGCGSGEYLSQMRHLGWEVEGIEPDARAVGRARNVHGLKVQCAVPEEGRFPLGSFDLVTMIHVIEHVHDPAELVATCRRWLKPGGRLIVVTPNSSSLGRRWFGRNWFAWEVPRHLSIFSPHLLALTTKKAGLKVDRLFTCGLLTRFVWEESSRIAAGGNPASRVRRLMVKAGGSVFGLVERLSLRFGDWGEEIVLIASNDPPPAPSGEQT